MCSIPVVALMASSWARSSTVTCTQGSNTHSTHTHTHTHTHTTCTCTHTRAHTHTHTHTMQSPTVMACKQLGMLKQITSGWEAHAFSHTAFQGLLVHGFTRTALPPKAAVVASTIVYRVMWSCCPCSASLTTHRMPPRMTPSS